MSFCRPRNTGIVPPLPEPTARAGIEAVSGQAVPSSPAPDGAAKIAQVAANRAPSSFKPADAVNVVTLVEARPGRLGLEISNSLASTGTLYLLPSSGGDLQPASGRGIPVAAGQTWTPPIGLPYEGEVRGIWDVDGGATNEGAMIVEYLRS